MFHWAIAFIRLGLIGKNDLDGKGGSIKTTCRYCDEEAWLFDEIWNAIIYLKGEV